MATPMRDGALDGGHRGKVADFRTTAAANFDDDNEWDVGIGDLIIDLDADIEKSKEKAGEAGGTAQMAQPTGRAKLAVEHSATVHDKGLKMKIKRTKPGTKTSEAKHEIVKSNEQNGDEKKLLMKRTSGGHRKEKTQDKARDKPEVNGVATGPVVPRPVFPASHGPGPPGVLPNGTNPLPTPLPNTAPSAVSTSPGPPVAASPKLEPPRLTAATPGPGACGSEDRSCSPPPMKKPRNSVSESKDAVDVCVGTSVGTITEPDCLGPCEPGTSVTLEGIVWHETGAGVLVVNVTWRGKTYVGTLLDCTRHDWAPPRFCDSPTSDLDSRAPKGRGKRGRAGAQGTDLTNFTETRSSVHSKLRNGNAKGRSGRSTTPSVAGPGSPTPRTETSTKPKPKESRDNAQQSNSSSNSSTSTSSSSSSTNATTTPTAAGASANANATAAAAATSGSGAAVASPTVRKSKPSTPNSPPPSPVLLECPEPNCCKKYKHINGLKYHQSHAHGSADDEDTKDGTSLSETEESNAEAPSPAATPDKSPAEKTDPPGKETPTTPAPQDPLALPEPSPEPPVAPATTPPLTDSTKSVVKPGVLRFGPVPEDFAFSSKAVIAPVAPQPLTQASAPQQLPIKLPQFKVKSPAALMPEDKLKDRSKLPGYKKKKKSPEGSPHASNEPSSFTSDSGNREDLQSPAYSDISDDAAPVLESEVGDKSKGCADKKGEAGDASSAHGMSPYVGLFNSPFYNQPPYLVPSVPTDCKSNKEQLEKSDPKSTDKEIKKELGRPDFSQKLLQHPSHFYSFGYVSGYPGGFVDSGYPVMMDDKGSGKEGKGDKSPGPVEAVKHGASPIQVPNPSKVKSEQGKHSNENLQIIKESIEMKNQMSQFMYSRQPGNPMQDDLRRYLCQRAKETDPKMSLNKTAPPNPSPKPKDNNNASSNNNKSDEKIKDKEMKQEGQKPTMETQGPPPPPTGQFAFIHPSYMQGPHYPGLPFDPSHTMYRGMNPMIVPGPYGGAPYLGMPRYHAPEDLSRSQGTTKALDLLQHHANQYYSSHKIHELQERALKSPTPGKATPSRESPSAQPRPPSGTPPAPPTSSASPMTTDGKSSKLPTPENLDSRSPPTQRHVHTHHHTHVGLTYPLLPGQYTAPYGAAVLASQQAAAVASVINPYQPK